MPLPGTKEVSRPTVQLEKVDNPRIDGGKNTKESLEEAHDEILVHESNVPPVAGVQQPYRHHQVEGEDDHKAGQLLEDHEGAAQPVGQGAGKVLQGDDYAVEEVEEEEDLEKKGLRDACTLDSWARFGDQLHSRFTVLKLCV